MVRRPASATRHGSKRERVGDAQPAAHQDPRDQVVGWVVESYDRDTAAVYSPAERFEQIGALLNLC